MKTKCYRGTHRALTILTVFIAVTVLGQTNEAQATDFLFFSTDIHNKADQLQDQLSYTCLNSIGENTCNFVGLVGDYNSGDPTVMYSSDTDISNLIGEDGYIDNVIGEAGIDYNVAISEGNHDEHVNDYFDPGVHPSGFVTFENPGEKYDIYRINTEDFGSVCSRLSGDLAALDENYNKVIFVMSHYPLHSYRSGIDQAAASCIFNVLNYQAVENKRDIVFLWGHNHYRSQRPDDYDENVRMIAGPGNTVAEIVPENFEESPYEFLNSNAYQKLSFSYVNAGYTIAASKDNPGVSASTKFAVIDTWIAILRYVGDTNPGFKLVLRMPYRD